MLAATNQIIKSEVEIKNNIDKLREINLKIRLDYVDGKRRETIRKIIMCYKDILAFEEIHYRTTHSHNTRLNLKIPRLSMSNPADLLNATRMKSIIKLTKCLTNK